VFDRAEMIPVAQAAIQLRLSYNQVRRLLAIGEIEGGFDPRVGYYVSAAALEKRGKGLPRRADWAGGQRTR
jgi:hypothetical protein